MGFHDVRNFMANWCWTKLVSQQKFLTISQKSNLPTNSHLGLSQIYNDPCGRQNWVLLWNRCDFSFIEIMKLYDPQKWIDSSNNEQILQEQTHIFNGNPIINCKELQDVTSTNRTWKTKKQNTKQTPLKYYCEPFSD